MLKHLRKNDGFIYLGIAIVVLVLFGMIAYTLSNLLVISNGKNANLYIDTQAELAAAAGIEYAFDHLMNDFPNWMGSSDFITFGKSKFFVQVDTLDEDGTKLTVDLRRVVSTGVTESSVKKIQVMFSAFQEAFYYSIYINELEDPTSEYVLLGDKNRISGDIYIGTNVYVETEREYIDTTTIYVPPGCIVTSDYEFDDTYRWEVYSPPLPEFPIFDTTVHDSLIAIASSITSTTGNKIYGDLTIDSEWDLSTYENNTVFIKGDLVVSGSDAKVNLEDNSLTTVNPGYIIVDGTVEYKTGCSFGDNIITIASDILDFKSTGTQYGLDWSHLAFNERPNRVNEIFSRADANIAAGIVFANVESLGNLVLGGTIYTASYTAGTVEIDSDNFQGSIVANNAEGDMITKSIMDFIPKNFVTATGGLKPTIVPGSWKWL